MTPRSWTIAVAGTAAILGVAACKTDQSPETNSAGEVSAGATTNGGADTGTSTDTGTNMGAPTGTNTSDGTGSASIPTLVNVNLQNVLNDLSVSLQVNRDNIPVNAQVPIDVAANVCGVSVSALAASIASGQAGCTATTVTPQLSQAVQQQIASGGSVGGGDQTMGNTTTNNMM
jgi:hypothetical protein